MKSEKLDLGLIGEDRKGKTGLGFQLGMVVNGKISVVTGLQEFLAIFFAASSLNCWA